MKNKPTEMSGCHKKSNRPKKQNPTGLLNEPQNTSCRYAAGSPLNADGGSNLVLLVQVFFYILKDDVVSRYFTITLSTVFSKFHNETF